MALAALASITKNRNDVPEGAPKAVRDLQHGLSGLSGNGKPAIIFGRTALIWHLTSYCLARTRSTHRIRRILFVKAPVPWCFF
jgi:hypothetical protein